MIINKKQASGKSRRACRRFQSNLADLDAILTVLVGDAARATHSSRLLWLEFGGCETPLKPEGHHPVAASLSQYAAHGMHGPPRKAKAQATRTACATERLTRRTRVPSVCGVELLEERTDTHGMPLCVNVER
jgi:hypothetical protein